jgi:Xaa-Pro aminopeptidase
LSHGFPAELFAARRETVLEELGRGAMILPASPILHRNGDTEIRYRPGSELFYLTGFVESQSLLLLRGFAAEERAILFTLPKDPTAELWTGARVGPEAARDQVHVDTAHSIERLTELLPGLLRGADRVHFRLGASPIAEAAMLSALADARIRGARDGRGPWGTVDPGHILDEMRLRKAPEEIAALREAAQITEEGFRHALSRVAPGAGEWEIEAEIEGEFRRRGALGPSFPTIAASGSNACVLHYSVNSRQMQGGDLLLLDAGADRRMYAGDITRTVPVSGTFSAEQRAVYDLVELARGTGVASVAPGSSVAEIHREVVRVMTEGLVTLGVLEGEVDGLIESQSYRGYFPHNTSHWLGLDTHDVGVYVVDGAPRPLEPGMVLTIEPGLYFPPGGGTRFDGIGVRIEDDVLVTESGRERLTGALPTAADEIAGLVGLSPLERG